MWRAASHPMAARWRYTSTFAWARPPSWSIARIEDLKLGRRFDVVLLASHLISTGSRAQRRAFWLCCARHAKPAGTVIVERYEPVWLRGVGPRLAVDGDVSIELHDVERHGGTLRATVTYRIDDREWHQPLFGAALDDTEFFDEAQAVGLAFDSWMEPRHEWASFTTGT